MPDAVATPPPIRLALIMLRMNVVVANAARPSGPGSAGVQPAVRPAVGSGAGATSASRGRLVAAISPPTRVDETDAKARKGTRARKALIGGRSPRTAERSQRHDERRPPGSPEC